MKLLKYISTSYNRFKKSFPTVTLEIEQNQRFIDENYEGDYYVFY
jgi:hypothetical protein